MFLRFSLRSMLFAFVLSAGAASAAQTSEIITAASYNIEHFQSHFSEHQLTSKLDKELKSNPDIKEMLYQLRKANDEDNWEAAQVILDHDVNPDVLVIEEGCNEENLEYFNKRWLRGAYATTITFPTNTGERQQNLNMLLKPGFKVLKKNDEYYKELDVNGPDKTKRLFARGPSFVLVQSPGGYTFWIGVTHQKSKLIGFEKEDESAIKKANSGKPKDEIERLIKQGKDAAGKRTAEWRNREAKRTHEIMKELSSGGPADVLLLGDMNDELGMDDYEKMAGADAIDLLVGPKDDGFILVTKPLIDRKEQSFGGYWVPTYRSFIDQVIATPTMRTQFVDVKVFRGGLAPAASDHFPVVVKFRADGVGNPAEGMKPAPR